MRIGQLARRLGIPPSDILGFLGTQSVETEAGANSRVSDDLITRIVTHFAPEKLSEILDISPVEEPVAEVAPVAEATEVTEVTEEAVPEPTDEETIAVDEAIPEGPVEVIRVSKVELQGLKVLGKIDLPEPKKKTEATPVPEPRKEFQKRNDRRDREWRNPLELKRQQEARDGEERRKEEAERLKEQRTNHYYKKVKSVPTKAVRRVEEQTVVEDIEIREVPKTVIGKFFRWLRT